jgi:hypothetical protein
MDEFKDISVLLILLTAEHYLFCPSICILNQKFQLPRYLGADILRT